MKKIALRYGLLLFIGLISFFLIMHLVGVSNQPELRVFNGIIHFSILFLAIRAYRKHQPKSVDNYVSGVSTGMYTTLFGVGGFLIFMFLFFLMNPTFLQEMKSTLDISKYLNPFTAIVFILAEGLATGLIMSYIVTRWVDMRMENRMQKDPYTKRSSVSDLQSVGSSSQ